MFAKLLLAFTFFLSSSVYADWIYFASTADMKVFVSDSDFYKSRVTIKAWDLAEFKNPVITGTKAQETYREFDCNKKTSKILKMKTYDKNGKLTDSYRFLPDWHSKPKQGTMADALIMYYCN
jgi:hypothetical protein